MSQVETVHDSGSTFRRIDRGAVTYEFEVVDRANENDLAAYEYAGDGDAPNDALVALRKWIDEYHDEVRDTRDVEESDDE